MYKDGTRIKLVYTNDPYTNLVPGDEGTITGYSNSRYAGLQVWVKWDNGSTLSMLPNDGDMFEILSVPK